MVIFSSSSKYAVGVAKELQKAFPEKTMILYKYIDYRNDDAAVQNVHAK